MLSYWNNIVLIKKKASAGAGRVYDKCIGWEPPFEERRFPNPPSNLFVAFCGFRRQPHNPNHGQSHESCLRNPQKRTKVLGRGVQSEHVNDPARPGLRSAERGESTLFQKGGPNQHE